ncbi:MAG: hypothetical protein RL846_39090, partial [Deltaproteobacteria bacterium]
TVPVQADPRFAGPMPRVVTPPPLDEEDEATLRAPSRPPIETTAAGPLVAPIIPAAPVQPLDPEDPHGSFVRIDPSAAPRPELEDISTTPPDEEAASWLPYATVGLLMIVVLLLVLLIVKG